MARLILLLLLLPILAAAQTVVNGKVLSANSKAPIAHASVFLSNSSSSTSTLTDGSFTLKGLKPGQYTLIVSVAGYEDNTQVILINTEPVKLNIELLPKPIQLREVTISTITRSDRELGLGRFKKEFIGDDANAGNCKIINPEVLNLSFRQNKNILEANSDDFLIVENQALGYRIKFQVKSFKSDAITHDIEYNGERFFEELDGSNAQKKRWHKKRDEAYYGSAMQFYRELYKDSLVSSDFEIRRLTRKLNPDRPADDVIQQNIDKAKKNNEVYFYWTNVKQLARYIKETLADNTWTRKDIVRKTDYPALLALKFPDYLNITYTRKWETDYSKNTAPIASTHPTTIVSFAVNTNYIIFDANGTIIGVSPVYEGSWAKARLSAMLPVDYMPYGKQP